MLSDTKMPFMLSVIMLNVVMLNVVMLNVIMLNVIMLNVIMMNVVMLSIFMLSVIMLQWRGAQEPNLDWGTRKVLHLVGFSLTRMLEKHEWDKHSIFKKTFVNYERKKFYKIGSRCQRKKNFCYDILGQIY